MTRLGHVVWLRDNILADEQSNHQDKDQSLLFLAKNSALIPSLQMVFFAPQELA